jgi:hypothetical protein
MNPSPLKNLLSACLSLAFLLPCLGHAQTFVNAYRDGVKYTGGQFAHDPTQQLVALAGNRTDTLGGYDIVVTLTREDGSLIRSRNLEPGGTREQCNDLWLNDAAQTFVAGSLMLGANEEALITRMDTLGMLSWSYLFGGTMSQETFNSVMGFTDSLGSKQLVMAGRVKVPGTPSTHDAWLALSPAFFPSLTGSIVYAGPLDEEWNAVTYTEDHLIVSAGQVTGLAGELDILVACHETDGTLRWVKTIGGAGNERALAVASRHGDIFVGGSTTSTPFMGQSAWVARLDLATGNTEKMVAFPGNTIEQYHTAGIVALADSTLLVTGGGAGVGPAWIAKLDADLNVTAMQGLSGNGAVTGASFVASGDLLFGGLDHDTLATGMGDVMLCRSAFDLTFAGGCGSPLSTSWPTITLTSSDAVDSNYVFTPTLTYWNLNPATDSTVATDICVPTGVIAEEMSPELVCAPQPANDWLRVQLPALAHSSQLSLFSLEGKRVLPSVVVAPFVSSVVVELSSLPAGMYWLVLDGGSEKIGRKVWVVR